MSTGFREPEQLAIDPGDAVKGAAWSAREPERLLLDAIAAGELDSHLTAIADAVDARRHLLHTVRSATALAELCIGDVVRINDTVSPQYLHGAYATIVAIDDRTATVQLERPVGRSAAAKSAAQRWRSTASHESAEYVVQRRMLTVAAVR